MTAMTRELLSPAGDLSCLKTALRYGASAVYLGGEAFGLRAKATNFTMEEMREGISFAHAAGAKVYVTANVFAHEKELKEAAAYFEELAALSPDAILVADPGMFSLAKKHAPQIPLHISTQADVTNSEACLFWAELGASRIVLARELPFAEIRALRERIPAELELEAFVHGAMCISYSGRCLLSAYMSGRDANRGACTHPCRWSYELVEETRQGERFPIEENERGTFIMASTDLCMVEHLEDLYASGIDSFKIEGRMKNPLYVAQVSRAYALAMQAYETDPAAYRKQKARFLEMASACTHRPFGSGFYYGAPTQLAEKDALNREMIYLGIIEEVEDGSLVIRQKNKFAVGDEVTLIRPDGTDAGARVTSIRDAAGNEKADAPHPLEVLRISLSADLSPLAGEILCKRSC